MENKIWFHPEKRGHIGIHKIPENLIKKTQP